MTKDITSMPLKMVVIATKSLNVSTRGLTLEFVDKKEGKNFKFTPGQFILVSLPGFGEVALSITSTVKDLPKIEIGNRTTGSTTQAINRLKVGDELFIRGPFGNSFPMNEIYGKEIILVSGGIGLAPLRSLIETLSQEKNSGKVRIFAGAKSPEDFIYKNDIKRWEKSAEIHLAVNECDSDWIGHVGKVTDLFKKITVDKDSIAILCGPPAMYLPTIDKLKSLGLKENQIHIMLERRIRCGIGKCQHCTCGDKYVCLDGPTFRYDEIKDNWEALA